MPTIKRGEPVPICNVPGCANVCKRHTNKVEDGKVKYRAVCRYHKKWGRETKFQGILPLIPIDRPTQAPRAGVLTLKKLNKFFSLLWKHQSWRHNQ
jgi:hypothetical protein